MEVSEDMNSICLDYQAAGGLLIHWCHRSAALSCPVCVNMEGKKAEKNNVWQLCECERVSERQIERETESVFVLAFHCAYICVYVDMCKITAGSDHR